MLCPVCCMLTDKDCRQVHNIGMPDAGMPNAKAQTIHVHKATCAVESDSAQVVLICGVV